MKGMLNAWGEVLRLDLPDERLGGVEHEDQRLLVAQQRLDGLQMQLHLERPKKGTGIKKRNKTLVKSLVRKRWVYICQDISLRTNSQNSGFPMLT